MSDIGKIEDPKWTLRQKCAECIKGPGNLLKTLIVVLCIGMLLQQITACVKKLIDRPITTYTHFDFNKTLMYPSVTFCREPPYKFGKMLEYGLYAHPRFTSTWRDFDFANITLDQLWEEITFNETDMFLHAGLNGLLENVDLKPTMGFSLGRCYTMVPKIESTEASLATGYSVSLQHTMEDITTTTSVIPPGYHVYIHYTREPFTEVRVYNGGLVDKLYVNVGETLHIKLKVDQYKKISRENDLCVNEANYSANDCTTKEVWQQAIAVAGCSGPWMHSDLPRCDNFTAMSTLITTYMNTYKTHHIELCPRTCHSFLYNGYVMDRQKFYTWDSGTRTWSVFIDQANLQTHVYLHFNSMMVSVYEERYNYDWNLFVSDLGGSVELVELKFVRYLRDKSWLSYLELYQQVVITKSIVLMKGFLLGLSVISLLEICGKTWKIFLRPVIKSKKKTGSITSTDTADVKTRQEYINEWNKNIKG